MCAVSGEGRLPYGESPLDARLMQPTSLELINGLTNSVALLRMANAEGDLRHVDGFSYLAIALSDVRAVGDRLGEDEQTIPDTLNGLYFASGAGHEAVGFI